MGPSIQELLVSITNSASSSITNCTASPLSSEEALSCLLSPSGPAPYKFDAPKVNIPLRLPLFQIFPKSFNF